MEFSFSFFMLLNSFLIIEQFLDYPTVWELLNVFYEDLQAAVRWQDTPVKESAYLCTARCSYLLYARILTCLCTSQLQDTLP
jgi:hypothetical protein